LLSSVYISHGFTIYPHRQVIARGVEIIQVRPKTFALLLLLLERPREVLSKGYLLDTIWDDVMVDEQVLVQSIRELRQLFGNAEIIQTYPRKGYAWAVSVQQRLLEEQDSSQTFLETSLKRFPENFLKSFFNGFLIPIWRRVNAFPVVVVVFVAVAVIFYALVERSNYSVSRTDVVIVLPVKNQIPGTDHNWVSLGAMDQLIKSLVSDRNAQVMDTSYVLNLMHNTKLPYDYDTEQVARIFSASGATMIVESQLSGSVEEYRLDYKFHFKNNSKRGALFETNLSDLLYNLALTIAAQTGQSLIADEVNSASAFGNELMARALEKLDAQEFELAKSLLMSLKQLEPNNAIARRLLADVLLRQGQFDMGVEEITSAIKVATARESARLHFLLAQAKAQQGLIHEALIILEQAHQLAERNSDVLYQGFIAQLRGNIQQKLGSFVAAETSFKEAIKYHGIIRCPVGVTLTRLQMVSLFSAQGKLDVARSEYAKAKQLVATHHLDYLLSELENAKALLSSKLSSY
jgi:DNA-binding winged helix-turn-helix (wHTH) protein/tetratricopeptide (TPR) repeat protein